MKQLNFGIEDNLHDQVQAEAKRLGISMSAFIRMMLQAWFQSIKFEPTKSTK